MSDSNELLVLKKFYKSKKNQDNCETATVYISKALENLSTCFDMNVVEKYKENPDFMELCILHNILSLIDSKTQIEYISRCFNDFQIRAGKYYITEDEVFAFSIMSFVYSVFAIATAPDDSDVFENSFKNIMVALDLQGRRLKLGTYSKEKILEILNLPDNVIHTASDIYYSIWTFQIAHEIYHILCSEENSILQEIEADKFGYSTLIKLIEMQKKANYQPNVPVFMNIHILHPLYCLSILNLLIYGKNSVE